MSVTVVPGARGSTTVDVTSASSAADGYYPVTLTAVDASDATRSVATSATYVVQTGLDVSVTTDRTSYSKSQTASITTTVRANGSPVSGASVTVVITRANGTTTNLAATTGSNGVAVVKYRFKRQDPPGAYQARSNATENGTITGNATTTFNVQ
jgi:hypothetical protein